MVSIPDWSRLGRLLEAPRESVTPGARYYKQREVEAVKQAEEHGYFLNVSRAYLESTFLEENIDPTRKKSVLDKYDVKEKDLGLIKMLKLVNAHMRTVGDIGLCTNLTICILSSNYITRIDGLISCTHLIKLDLHSNQISMLPGSGFWMCLRALKLLHLHDNPIGRLENLNSLAACPSLVALTLYDTPLSLKRNYRHHVVNSIWSLRALDYYVISDEEIIEDADFGGRFAALHHSFAIDLCPTTKEDSDYTEEACSAGGVLAEINAIQAHSSPVLIIQRHVRGFLIRKIVQFDRDLKHWPFPLEHMSRREEDAEDKGAAMTIQRQYRGYKGLSSTHQPPSTPAAATAQPAAKQRDTPTDSSRLDYDTYMKNRRPGSRPSSHTSLPSIHAHRREQAGSAKSSALPPTPVPSASLELSKRHIFINLAKLQSGTLQSLHDDALTMDTQQLLPSEGSLVARTDPATARREKQASRNQARAKPKSDDKQKKRVVKSVKQFFGPVVQTVASPEPHCDTARGGLDTEDAAAADEIPLINFRLKGLKEKVKYYDPLSEVVVARREAGREVRAAEDEHHRKLDQQPRPTVDKQPTVSKDQHIFNRVQNTMGLSCLWAVHQAYRDRSKAEKAAAKMESVLSTKEQRDAARERIKLYHEERRLKAIKDREADKKRALETIERKELSRLNYIESAQDRRRKSSQAIKQRRAELTFMSDFTVQNNSVSNALLRHDRAARCEDQLVDRGDTCKVLREGERDQQDVVRKYLEHRQLMRQTETAMQRAALDTKMLQEANDRLMEAKARVLQQKARSATVEAFYPMPAAVASQALPPMTPGARRVTSMEGLDRYQTSVLMVQGRVGRHPTQVTM